jgi:2-oxoglutarate/2-oxoacid ferredoxin oxidoreductase subunit alpha
MGLEIVRNTISLGVLGKLIGMDPAIIREGITGVYGRKSQKVADLNIRAIEAGENYVAANFDRPTGYALAAGVDGDRLIMMGNDAIAYGALVAGCRFMAGYPITPATDVLEWMAKEAPKYGGIAVQAEDELAAINMVIGAAFTGVRAMTATSGPGLSLMTEGVGLAGVLEVPIVIIECARAGPATGLPTKTEQSNLNHMIFGGHGEIPKIVIAPGTVEESFYMAIDAFNLAEKYQCPVYLVSEQALCQSKATLPLLEFEHLAVDRGKLVTDAVVFGEYRRFAFTEDGVSPRVIPGVEGGMHLAPGSEHNDMGVITENANNRKRMMEKRFQKLKTAVPDLPKAKLHSNSGARVALIGYGSNRGPIAEAQDRLTAGGIPTDFLQLRTLWPFPDDEIAAFVKDYDHIFIIEHSFTGQLARLVRAAIGPQANVHPVLKYNAKPFRPIEIIETVEQTANVSRLAGV